MTSSNSTMSFAGPISEIRHMLAPIIITENDVEASHQKSLAAIEAHQTREIELAEKVEKVMPPPQNQIIMVLQRNILPSTTIEEIALQMTPCGWIETFQKASDELSHISRIIHSLNRELAPSKENIFRAFDLCPLSKVKLVILGQNPYDTHINGVPIANGLAFSTSKGIPIGDSCRNIFREIQNEYGDFRMPTHGDLSSWAKQGVLLLNSYLTVPLNSPNDCHIVWESFIGRVFEAITFENPNCVFLLLGAKAQKWQNKLSNKSVKLMATHPSPNSAYRSSRDSPAFIGCGHFQKINSQLSLLGKIPINWNSVNEE